MQPNIIKIKSPLELILHFAEDEICHVIGEFKFPIWLDTKSQDDMELLSKIVKGVPSKIDIWFKDEE